MISSAAYPTIAACAWPLGKLYPCSCATGWARTGRSRWTPDLIAAFSIADPTAVTTGPPPALG